MFKYSVVIKGEVHRFESQMDKHHVYQQASEFFRKSNINFSPDSLMKDIERQSKITVRTKTLSFGDALNGALAALKFTAGKSTSPAEIRRRSTICSNCPLKDTVSGCFSCGMGSRIAKSVSSMRAKKGSAIAIPEEVKTLFCGFCGCAIPLMVVTQHEDFNTESFEINNKRPDNCWLKTTSPNFTNE